uniref:thiol oxidase n=1 Tax=viral metagenome TaxID=1070528 RepID=A0A6C0B2A6_9ZZZZ
MKFSPEVWGPHYWFFLHTVAESYPQWPNQITKRKYYDLIQNFPLFMPDQEMGDKFSRLLDKYPIVPYLDSRESFVRWTFFVHNKINSELGKEELSLPVALDKYHAEYKPRMTKISETLHIRKHLLYALFIIGCFLLIYVYHK